MKSKNRTDKISVVPETVKKTTAPTSASGKTARGPAKFGLEGNKWVIENQVDNQSIVIDKTEPKQVVYIFGCSQSVIQIKGKVNAISIDNCDKTGVVFENAISSVEVVNSRSVQVEVQGRVPSIAIDKTSGFQVFLSPTTLDVEIVSSKSSEMNVSFAGPDKEMIELAIPEQYKTYVKDFKLHTTSTSHV